MPEFILDTAGGVRLPRDKIRTNTLWSDLPAGVRGYLEAAYFTDACNPDAEGIDAFTAEHGEPGFAHLAPESLAAAIQDWSAFEEKARELLTAAYERDYDETQAGRDFWYTRNGHGVGFWDRDELKPDSPDYERLTAEMVAASQSGDNAAWAAACRKRSALSDESLGARLSDIADTFGECNVSLDPAAGRVWIE